MSIIVLVVTGAYSESVIALSLGQAKTIAIVVASALVIGSIGAAWLMKSITQKLVAGIALAALALVVWSQRTALDECAEDVRSQLTSAVSTGAVQSGSASIETTCRFLGRDVSISAGSAD